MFKRIKCAKQVIEQDLHPEHQNRDTTVSSYLMKYGQGKIDEMPSDSRPEIKDNRSVDEMLEEGDPFGLGTEELDVLTALQDSADKWNTVRSEAIQNKNDRTKFENAVKVLNDENASLEAKRHAYSIIDKLDRDGKLEYVED